MSLNVDDWRGNIIFYSRYGSTFLDRLSTRVVQTFTHGPYVHCEVVYGQKEGTGEWITIGAHGDGIKYGLLPPVGDAANPYVMAGIQTLNMNEEGGVMPLDQHRLAYGLEWMRLHLDVSYGKWDNFDQFLDVVAPWNKVHFVEQNHFNCSNFATAFLLEAGIHLPADFSFPFDVTPNDLAEWLGLLPERKRIRL